MSNTIIIAVLKILVFTLFAKLPVYSRDEQLVQWKLLFYTMVWMTYIEFQMIIKNVFLLKLLMKFLVENSVCMSFNVWFSRLKSCLMYSLIC